MADRFDVVVVGAGPAGSAAAITLARSGVDVIMLEKAQLPGQRNVSGGVLFGGFVKGLGLIDLLPDFEEQAPIERKISGHELYILSKPESRNDESAYRLIKWDKKSLMTRLGLTMLNASSGHDYTVLRTKFDRWMAFRAVEEGAALATSKTVENLIFKDGAVVGVSTPDEEIYSDLVIDCSGTTSLLPEKAGMRQKTTPEQVYHGVKHIFKLPPQNIEEFFTYEDGYKSVYLLGSFMHGIVGGGFIYPNKDSLSVGVVMGLSSAIEVFTSNFEELGKPYDILKEMESHPFVSQLIKNASLVEYSAHNIPRGYKVIIQKPYIPGFLVAGDALGVFYKIGALIDGMRPAIASGILAAQTYLHAKKAGDFSDEALQVYRQMLQPLYSLVGKSKTNSMLLERKMFYNLGSSALFKLGFGKTIKTVSTAVEHDALDAVQKIQAMTGLLDYQEDRERAHIVVNQAEASQDARKAWVPLCPVNCYTLVNDKGVFASFRDLFRYNLSQIGGGTNERFRKAYAETLKDIQRSTVKFDHVACVACGTCGVIGPPAAVSFGHEWNGRGVRFKYG
ncbi:MAG: FAD-dependent oxidoreductase [Candidatus Caldarchaeum sp.]|nr:FAD-dependent oxidoreductase [Candidatus Caldarchaeum sp.]